MNRNSFMILFFALFASFYGLCPLSAQSVKEDILREKEYTLQEWYDLNPSIYTLLLKPSARYSFSSKVHLIE